MAYFLFETPLGLCGIAWSEGGNPGDPLAVTALQLPESTTAMTESRIARKSNKSTEAPPEIAQVIARIGRHLQGDIQDFRDVTVDLGDAAPFARRVYKASQEIPAGETRTYGELARLLGQAGAARAVGRALSQNPVPLIIPCHRILAAGGRPGGFSAYGGAATKARLLAIEGVTLSPPPARPLAMELLWSQSITK